MTVEAVRVARGTDWLLSPGDGAPWLRAESPRRALAGAAVSNPGRNRRPAMLGALPVVATPAENRTLCRVVGRLLVLGQQQSRLIPENACVALPHPLRPYAP